MTEELSIESPGSRRRPRGNPPADKEVRGRKSGAHAVRRVRLGELGTARMTTSPHERMVLPGPRQQGTGACVMREAATPSRRRSACWHSARVHQVACRLDSAC